MLNSREHTCVDYHAARSLLTGSIATVIMIPDAFCILVAAHEPIWKAHDVCCGFRTSIARTRTYIFCDEAKQSV